MSKSNGSGGLAWITVGLLVATVLSQCGKDKPPTTPMALGGQFSVAPERWLYVQTRSLNCRAGPTRDSVSLRTLVAGEYVGVLKSQGDWSQLGGGALCWARTSYLAPEKPEPAKGTARQDATKSTAGRLSVLAIKRRMIAASIESYPGNCPCPYNSAQNGSRCGGRSAYSRGGGYAPVCYAGDISAADVDAWRDREL